jgi:hypothetical protein
MLRVPQHERKKINDIKSPPSVLSPVEAFREHFSATLLVAFLNLLQMLRTIIHARFFSVLKSGEFC